MSRYSHSTRAGNSNHRASHDSLVGRRRGLEPDSSDLFSRDYVLADTARCHAHGGRKSQMLAKFCQVFLNKILVVSDLGTVSPQCHHQHYLVSFLSRE